MFLHSNVRKYLWGNSDKVHYYIFSVMFQTRRPKKFLILSEVVAYFIWLPVIMTSARESESEEGMLRM